MMHALVLLVAGAGLVVATRRRPEGTWMSLLQLAWLAWWVELFATGALAVIAPPPSDQAPDDNRARISLQGDALLEGELPDAQATPLETRWVRPTRFGSASDAPLRVLVLGDSFARGDGVLEEETYGERVGQALHDATGRTVEVHNHGLSGSSFEEHADIYWAHSRLVQPDLVLWNLTLNDLGEVLVDDTLGMVSQRGETYDLINDEVKRFASTNWSRAIGLARHTIVRWRMHRDTLSGYQSVFAPDSPNLARFVANVSQVKADVAAQGATLLVVTFPLLFDLHDYPLVQTHDNATAALTQANVPVLDLWPAFQGREAAELVVSPTDAHPNAEGHAIAADAIVAHLDPQEPSAWRTPCPPSSLRATDDPWVAQLGAASDAACTATTAGQGATEERYLLMQHLWSAERRHGDHGLHPPDFQRRLTTPIAYQLLLDDALDEAKRQEIVQFLQPTDPSAP